MFNTSNPWVAHGYPNKQSFKRDTLIIELGYEQNKREKTCDNPKEFYQSRFLKQTGRRPWKKLIKLPNVADNNDVVKSNHIQIQRQNSLDDEYIRYYDEVYSNNETQEMWMDERVETNNSVATQTNSETDGVISPRNFRRFKRPHSAQIFRSQLVAQCPYCRPVSSSSNRPKSATGLIANQNHGHICRHVMSQRKMFEHIKFSNFIKTCQVSQRPPSSQANFRRQYIASLSNNVHGGYDKADALKHEAEELVEVEHMTTKSPSMKMINKEEEEDVDEVLYLKESSHQEVDDEDIDMTVVTDVIINERESIEPKQREFNEPERRKSIKQTNNMFAQIVKTPALSSSDQHSKASDEERQTGDDLQKQDNLTEEEHSNIRETLSETSNKSTSQHQIPNPPENSLESSENSFESAPPLQKVDIMSGHVIAIVTPYEDAMSLSTEAYTILNETINQDLPDPIPIATHSYPPIESVVVVEAREQLKFERESSHEEDYPSNVIHPTDQPVPFKSDSSIDVPPSILKRDVSAGSRRPSEVRFAPEVENATSSETESEMEQLIPEEDGGVIDEMISDCEENIVVEKPDIQDEKITLQDVIEEQPQEDETNNQLTRSELIVIGDSSISPMDIAPPEVIMETNCEVLTQIPDREVKVKVQKKPPVEPKPPPEPIKPVYIEPQSVELRKLLAPPDLTDFDVPWPDPPKPKEKKKRKLCGKRKKKKKGKREPKLPSKPIDPKTFFTYDPNAISPLKMAEEHLANRPREDPDMREIIDFVQAFNNRFKKEAKSQPWLHGRVALSRQICRFMLPIDLKQLQGLSACGYLQDYCRVCKRRQKLYMTSFDKQVSKRKNKNRIKEAGDIQLDYKELREAFKDVHVGMVTAAHIDSSFALANVSQEDLIPLKLFCALCALSERTLYSEFITEDTDTHEYAAKELIENADFVGLQSKLEGLDIREDLKTLLLAI